MKYLFTLLFLISVVYPNTNSLLETPFDNYQTLSLKSLGGITIEPNKYVSLYMRRDFANNIALEIRHRDIGIEEYITIEPKEKKADYQIFIKTLLFRTERLDAKIYENSKNKLVLKIKPKTLGIAFTISIVKKADKYLIYQRTMEGYQNVPGQLIHSFKEDT